MTRGWKIAAIVVAVLVLTSLGVALYLHLQTLIGAAGGATGMGLLWALLRGKPAAPPAPLPVPVDPPAVAHAVAVEVLAEVQHEQAADDATSAAAVATAAAAAREESDDALAQHVGVLLAGFAAAHESGALGAAGTGAGTATTDHRAAAQPVAPGSAVDSGEAGAGGDGALRGLPVPPSGAGADRGAVDRVDPVSARPGDGASAAPGGGGAGGGARAQLPTVSAAPASALPVAGPLAGGGDGRPGDGRAAVRPGDGDALILGLDVSGWQDFKGDAPTAAFFTGAAADGRKFCAIKTSEVGYTNGKRWESRSKVYASRYAAGTARGLHCGAYHYAAPIADLDDARRQAQLCFSVCGRWVPGDLPPWLDLEDAPHALTCAQLVAWTIAFLRELERLMGCRPAIYTYLNFVHERLAGPEAAALAEWDLVLACYSGNTMPRAPKPWTSLIIWQRTGTGRRPFWPGDLDLDVFCGTAAELDAYCRRGST